MFEYPQGDVFDCGTYRLFAFSPLERIMDRVNLYFQIFLPQIFIDHKRHECKRAMVIDFGKNAQKETDIWR